MKYIHIENNQIKGFYDSNIHKNIPTECISISEGQWQYALSSGANAYIDGEFIVYDFRTDDEIAQENEATFRAERDRLLVDVVDHYQKPLVWEGLTAEQQEKVRVYRQELLDSTIDWVLPEPMQG